MAVRKRRGARRASAPVRARKKSTPPRKRKPAAQPERRQSARETLRLRSVEPTFTVSDLDRSVRFYTDVLGFIMGNKVTDNGGIVRGVMLKAGVCQLRLWQDDWAKGRDRQRGVAVRVWCTTAQDIDGLGVRIKAAGGMLTEEPTELPWGGRSLGIDDPDGFHLTVYNPTR